MTRAAGNGVFARDGKQDGTTALDAPSCKRAKGSDDACGMPVRRTAVQIGR